MDIPSPAYGHVTIRDRGRLPHWETEEGVYFVTFHLGDSLPQAVLSRLEAERDAELAAIERKQGNLTATDRKRIKELFNERVDAYLDSGVGACYMARPEIGRLVADAVRHFDGQRYRLFTSCVMPNHVHAVLSFLAAHGLEDVLHSWKSFTSNEANRLIGRSGTFWAREYYDHIVRNEKEFEGILAYVVSNPAKAGLRDWPWVWVCPELRERVQM